VASGAQRRSRGCTDCGASCKTWALTLRPNHSPLPPYSAAHPKWFNHSELHNRPTDWFNHSALMSGPSTGMTTCTRPAATAPRGEGGGAKGWATQLSAIFISHLTYLSLPAIARHADRSESPGRD